MEKALKTFLIVLLSVGFCFPATLCHAAVSPMIGDFLCKKGVDYYNQGQFDKALAEFKKALLANPELKTAQDFIDKINGAPLAPQPEVCQAPASKKSQVVETYIEGFEKNIVPSKGLPVSGLQVSKEGVQELGSSVVAQQKKKTGPAVFSQVKKNQEAPSEEAVIDLNAPVAGSIPSNNIETSVGDRLILQSRGITRVLSTNQGVLKATRQSDQSVLVEPSDIGTSFLHLWDDQGLRTYKVTVGPRQLPQNVEELAAARFIEENLPDSFKFTYSIDDSKFFTGRGLRDQERQSHTMAYSSSVIGETPFGNFDASVRANRSTRGVYSVTTLRMGLTRGHYDQFKDINLRFFDFTPSFIQFGFPSTDLRGVMVSAPMFNKTFSYTAFQGALPQGGFTQLSTTSGLTKMKDAYLEGIGLDYKLGRHAEFKSFYAHSYGPELTQPVLTNETTGFGMDYYLGRFNIGTSAAYDMRRNISYTAHTGFNLSKLNIGLSMTDYDKNFASLLGGTPNSGYTNGTLNINYQATDAVTITESFSGNRDKVFGNPDDPSRPNYNSNTRLRWVLDSQSVLELAYTMDDLMGTISPSVTETKEVTFRKKLFFFRTLNTFISYSNRKSKNYTSPTQDYNDNRILAGFNFRVLSELYFYYNREFNFLYNKYYQDSAFPFAQEYGLNYYKQIWASPFYLDWRIYYRDEENTDSYLSYLSGEDRLEGEVELKYKPNSDSEVYLKCRLANVWADKSTVIKHFDVDLNWGLRFVWDTGLRWQPNGSFSGFVFYDTNADGIKQIGEKGVKGVVIKCNDGRKATTDERGFYKIPNIKGRKATLDMDAASVPKGYNATTAVHKEFDIVHWKTKRVDFGLMTRSEISGIVFVDKNNNGQYDVGEETVKGVVVVLDDKTKVASGLLGEYMFRKLSPEEHTVKIDLASIPIRYIPRVALQNKIKVLEGATFVYNIPLLEQKKESPKK